MPETTAFHSRLEELNQPKIWKNWSGYLVAPRYQYSVVSEYFAIRNSVAILDTSPLFKYRFSGRHAEDLLKYALARNVEQCNPGSAQYTVWCDTEGFVVQDGVIMNMGANEFRLTAAEPSLRYFRNIAKKMKYDDVTVEDISRQYGILAIQGPHSYNALKQLTDDLDELKYFRVINTTIRGKDVVISRTGFTGDLGYELWIKSEDAIAVWDAIISAGDGYNITPIGTTALKMARVEAGLLLMDVDFHSSRHAWVDAQRETPIELGWSWMFRNLARDNRDFIGRSTIESEIKERSSRWTTVGLSVDWHEYERAHVDAGIMPPKHELYCEDTRSLYRRGDKQWEYAGYASSFLFSSLLKKPIAIAKVPLDLATPGTAIDLEISVIRRPVNVLARVHSLPFHNPSRKTANVNEGAI